MGLIFQNPQAVVTPPTILTMSCSSNTLVYGVKNNHSPSAVIEISKSLNFAVRDTTTLLNLNASSTGRNGLGSASTGSVTLYARARTGTSPNFSYSEVTISTQYVSCEVSGGGGGCLDENTTMHLADGTTKILKDVKVGDWLLGYDFEDMPDESEPNWKNYTREEASSGYHVPVQVVFKVFDYYSSYYLINNDIKITRDHSLFIKRTLTNLWEWTDSSAISVGDIMLGKDRSEIVVETIEHIKSRLDVVTLDTEQTDNYFAGNNPVLVHNTDRTLTKA